VDLAKVQTVTTNIIIEDMVYTALFLKVVLQFRFTFTFGNCVARFYRVHPYSLALHIYIASLLHSYSINSVLHLLSPTIRDTRRQRLRMSTSLALDLLPIRLEDVSRILF
jgi:hypothetical protein